MLALCVTRWGSLFLLTQITIGKRARLIMSTEKSLNSSLEAIRATASKHAPCSSPADNKWTAGSSSPRRSSGNGQPRSRLPKLDAVKKKELAAVRVALSRER
jgi:hypothetical protein